MHRFHRNHCHPPTALDHGNNFSQREDALRAATKRTRESPHAPGSLSNITAPTIAITKGQTRRPGAQQRCFGDPAEEKKQPRNSSLLDRSKANSRRPQGIRRILPATKVRHTHARHAAQSAKQPANLCFLMQVTSNKLSIQACCLDCHMQPGHAQHQQSVQGCDNQLCRRLQGATATSIARMQRTVSSQAVAEDDAALELLSEVLTGSTCAEQARCAEVKGKHPSPQFPPPSITACHITPRRTSLQHSHPAPASGI